MWYRGTITVDGIEFDYYVKYYDKDSPFSLNGGRVSKLRIEKDGQTLCSYERGWDNTPTSAAAKSALDMLLERFN